jgi:hypothetical protein
MLLVGYQNVFTFASVPKDTRKLSSSLSRQLITYPHPKYYALTVGCAGLRNESKAEIVEECIKKTFDAMSAQEQARILTFYNKMTKEEKKYPHKINNHW